MSLASRQPWQNSLRILLPVNASVCLIPKCTPTVACPKLQEMMYFLLVNIRGKIGCAREDLDNDGPLPEMQKRGN